MATIAEVSSQITAAGASPAAAKPAFLSSDASEDRFLTLLVAQMKNQDPLNPLDNAQVTTQMAQISTVSGIEKLNATLQALAGSLGEAQSLQAAALIGRDVLVPGNAIELAGGVARGGFQLEEPADQLLLTILDASGRAVHRVDLGAQAAGVHSFQWDGSNDAGAPLAPGAYRFSVSAQRGGTEVSAAALAAARVLGVARDGSGTNLDLAGLGSRPYSNVKQIL
jgi:flagellar basal-body rod modification protein FlgD